MRRTLNQISLLFVALFFINPLWSSVKSTAPKKPRAVFWLSLDGYAFHYLTQVHQSPFFENLIQNRFTYGPLVPIFPSLTFPNHIAQATGSYVNGHGVSGNSFFDKKNQELYTYPGDSQLIEVSPIWQLASAQGLKVATGDWPMSYNQLAPNPSHYFHHEFDPLATDHERLEKILSHWQNETLTHPKLYDLVMAYVVGPDSIAHGLGTTSPALKEKLRELDQLLTTTLKRLEDLAQVYEQRGIDLYWLITSDHGMSDVTKAMNLDLLLENFFQEKNLDYQHLFTTLNGGNLGHLFLKDHSLKKIGHSDLNKIFTTIEKNYPFLKIYQKKMLPTHWQFDHKTRVGDWVFVLEEGHVFSSRPLSIVVNIQEIEGPLGMHGYDPQKSANMNGLFFWGKVKSKTQVPLRENQKENFQGDLRDPIDSLSILPFLENSLWMRPSGQGNPGFYW
jgi:predicted AlkP superfamily pyrophosphatase or phosphodiesterase